MAMFAGAGLQVLQDLVADLEAFQLHDADEFIAVLPDLALPEFERHGKLRGGENGAGRRNMSLLIYYVRRDTGGYFFFFLAAGFFLEALLTLAFFAITFFDLYCGLTDLRHGSFTAGKGIMLLVGLVVNDCSQILQGGWR